MKKSVTTIICLSLLLIISTSCTNSHTFSASSENKTVETPTEESNNEEVDMMALINQPYNERDMNSKLAEMRSKSENLAIEAWDLYEAATIGEWLYGNWKYSGFDEYVGRFTMYVNITENNLRWGFNGSESYNGPYEIDMETHQIIFDRHNGHYTHVDFDPQTERLLYENGAVFYKSECNTNTQQNSRSNSYYSSSYNGMNSNNNTSSTPIIENSQTALVEVMQLQNEVRLLINQSIAYRNRMNSEVYGSFNYQSARIEYMKTLSAAEEKQKKAIRIARNKVHDESLVRDLTEKLDLMKKAHYSD